MIWNKRAEEPPLETHTEVKANKGAQKAAVTQAKQANKQLKNILDENHFTLYIALAAGATIKRSKL